MREIGTPSHCHAHAPVFDTNNTNRTTSLPYQSAEFVASKVSNKQSTRMQNNAIRAKVIKFDNAVKLNLNADVN